ncbi:MAG: hypothetical protein ACRD3I_08060, partial [Terriglobales bacterium]
SPGVSDDLSDDLNEGLSEDPNQEVVHPRPAANAKHEPSFDEMFPKDPPAPPARRGPNSAPPRPAGNPRRRNSA